MPRNLPALVNALFANPDHTLSSQPNIGWMLNDLRKVLRPDQGPNLLASQCLLTGLEFVARFHKHKLPCEVFGSPVAVKDIPHDELYKFSTRPKGRTDTKAALTFIKDHFPAQYQEPLPGCSGTTKAETIWFCFRHGHVHGYVQKRIVLPSGKGVIAQASWAGRRHLQVYARGHHPRIFQVSLRQLFSDLETAIARFRTVLLDPTTDDELRERFIVAHQVWRRPVPLK